MTTQTISRPLSGYLSIFYHLLRRDLHVFRKEFMGKLFDTGSILLTTLILFGYFLPTYGLSSNFGAFILVGVIGGFGFFEIIGKVSQMIADLEGDRTILHLLSLPIPSWMVFVYYAISWATLSFIIGLLMIPIGKLVLFSQFDMGKVDFFKLFLIFVLGNLFFGFFALWLSSIFKKLSSVGHLFVRIVNPMYSFGGWMYAWHTAYQMSPILGYAHFINPLIYVMEGMRSAALGPEGFLPFWFSFFALLAFTAAFGFDAVRRLKKRLDCV